MSRTRLALLTLTAALSIIALSATTASAKISFEWFVGGSLLKEKETRAFHANSDGHTFDFRSTLAGNSILFLSSNISVENGVISGGKPGTNEETIVFKEVTVDNPANCTVETPGEPSGTVKTNRLKTEIVEGENGEVLILFTPKEGAVFTKLLLLGASCLGANLPANLEGSFLGLPLPQRTEVLRQNLVFEAKERNFFLSSGALDTAGITFAKNVLTFTGLTLLLLTNDAVFGPF